MSKAENKINQKMLMVDGNQSLRNEIGLNNSKARKLMVISSKPCIQDLNEEPYSDSEGEIEEHPQDAIVCVPQLQHELHVEIFARFSCCEYWKLQFLNREFSEMLKNMKFFKLRKERGIVKPYIFLHTGGFNRWMMFDKDFQSFQTLPQIPACYMFFTADKETICVGTQLIVIGKLIEGFGVWRYELEMSKWFIGPSMINPRTLYGSASHGNDAFFAGGITMDESRIPVVVSIAEKYNAETKIWTLLHEMHKRRKLCSGFFFRGNFYVIGGQDENGQYLTCGERYHEETNSWELIPNMLEDMEFKCHRSPPLIAVVDDNLYLLETDLNELRIYDIKENVWTKLGIVPIRADTFRGWGVAFKSIGDRLLLIGTVSAEYPFEAMSIYTCHPSPIVGESIMWEKTNYFCKPGIEFNHFIKNCCVMFA